MPIIPGSSRDVIPVYIAAKISCSSGASLSTSFFNLSPLQLSTAISESSSASDFGSKLLITL